MRLCNAQHIAEWRLCVGCGACYYVCPKKNITLHDVQREGVRPVLNSEECGKCDECVKVCPGYEMPQLRSNGERDVITALIESWGPVLEIWEGYATDSKIRFQGSSGGLASALSLYCLEQEQMHGVLHIGPDAISPYKNMTVLSRSRLEILSRTGSRYSPASPCDSLELIESAPGKCVFVGKPCDVAGVRKARALRPALDSNIGLSIGIFCAGTPATQGTLDLLAEIKVKTEDVEEIRYRGRGWPGKFSIQVKGEQQPRELMTYMDAWGFVQKYRPYRCYLCPDGTSEFADISCGDPWYRQIKEQEQGYSLVLVRTEKGRQILHGALKAGYISVERANPAVLEASQKNLLTKRGAIWGRLLALKSFGIPTPRLDGFSLFKNWLSVPAAEKLRSVVGTVRRIVQRKYYKCIGYNDHKQSLPRR